jgi:type IV secretory pathway VirJ component
VSVVASHDAPQKPRQLARRQDSLHFAHRPEGWRDKIREQDLAVSVETVRALAPALAELPERRAICVFGGREKIEACAEELGLNIVELMG